MLMDMSSWVLNLESTGLEQFWVHIKGSEVCSGFKILDPSGSRSVTGSN